MKTLLLNATFEVLQFVNERKAIKLLIKGKADVISIWPDLEVRFPTGFLHYPAVLKLRQYIRRKPIKLTFSRKSVFKRDRLTCQYCNKHLTPNQATMGHIVPRCLGGESSFTNCVTACSDCNRRKGRRTLEETGMTLKTLPSVPLGFVFHIPDEVWHEGLEMFLNSKHLVI